MVQTYISGFVISRLLACSRMAANEATRAGRFGPLLRRGRIAYAALNAVERRIGLQFGVEQVKVAVDGHPDRIIKIAPMED
jgi:hypothetical protein